MDFAEVVQIASLPRVTPEMLEALVICEHGLHQIDDNDPGVLAFDGRATTCPAHPTFNAAFEARASAKRRRRNRRNDHA